MSAPLGGLRRERKRLVRCAHRPAAAWKDPVIDHLIIDCRACGARVSVPPYSVRPDELHRHISTFLPPRIARKAVDE